MSGAKLLLPLRVPELGPSLGKLVVGAGRSAGWIALDGIRLRLATRVIEGAGEARRLAAREERSAALAAIGRAIWQEAWDEAVAGVAELLFEGVSVHLEAEARAVRMPRKLRARLRLNAGEKRAVTARLGSAGAQLVPLLDALEHHAAQARDATALEREAVEEAWQDSLKVAARRLEAAWLALEEAVEKEAVHWKRVADRVGAWRKPVWPVVVTGAAAMAVAVWLGLVLGGYVTPPEWFVRGWELVFE